jgi:hypothetical protein
MLLSVLPFSISKLCYIKIAVTLNEGYLNCLCDRTWIFLQSFYSSISLQIYVCVSCFNICVLCLLNIPYGLEVTYASFCSLHFLWSILRFVDNPESGQENRINGRRDPLRWPRDTLYPQKLALTSPICGGRSVGIVRLRTKGHGV